jgi:type II secretory pathway component GspD/PulD (secretin)
MKPLLLLPLLIAGMTLSFPPVAQAQSADMGGVFRQMPAKFEAIAQQLRDASPQQYDFSKSNLGDVLRFLATDAKISFISLPDDSPESSRVVTFSILGSPFSVLETLCKSNGLALLPEDNGMWYIRSADDKELLGKSYSVRYNPMEKVENVTEAGAQMAGGNGTIQSASVDLQGAKENFSVKRSGLINSIRAILDLEPENDQGVANAGLTGAQAQNPLQAMQMNNSNELSQMHQPKVLWQSDSNTLYVVATRLQHLWVEGYLLAADKQQSMIAIEVKFLESSSDPSKELGLDWSGTLGTSGTFRQASGLQYDTDKKQWKWDETMIPNKEGGFRFDAAELSTLSDLNQIAKTTMWPWPAILGGQDISVRLRALVNNQDTKLVSYPRMVTLNNREVVLRSVINQPVLDGSSAISSGGGAATSQSITYLPIGTVLNILPKKMEEDRVLLNIKVTVSSIVGEQLISGNSYPVATSRVYNAPVEVNDGYTVAIGGLDEAKEKITDKGVPMLGKIPVLGYLFKSKSREKNHKNLMLFITPTLIDPRGGGLPDEPQSVVRQRPDHALPKKPAIDAAGTLAGGPNAVPDSVAYLTRECDIIQTTIDENRATEVESKKLTEMKIALNQLEAQVEAMAPQHPDKANIFTQATIDMAQLHSRVGKMKRAVLKKAYY